jgi:hypothetical protein
MTHPNLHAIMAGTGNPNELLTPSRRPIVRALHEGTLLEEIAAQMDLPVADLKAELEPLLAAGLVQPHEDAFLPGFLVADAGETDFSNLQRPRHPMPDFVREALVENDLMEAYESRPAYQQNDYLGWINRAKRDSTKEKRLAQMLDEPAQGDVYMKMAWKPSKD